MLLGGNLMIARPFKPLFDCFSPRTVQERDIAFSMSEYEESACDVHVP